MNLKEMIEKIPTLNLNDFSDLQSIKKDLYVYYNLEVSTKEISRALEELRNNKEKSIQEDSNSI